MYHLSNGLSRALLVLAGILAVGALTSSPANADEPTPRAVPVARAYPRVFSSYDAVIAYASAVASDQAALDKHLAAVRGAQGDPGELLDTRGGYRRLCALERAESKAFAAGALTSEAVPWQMASLGQITQPFGPTKLRVEPARTYAGVYYAHFHDGVDIAGDWMAAVVAPTRGRVVYVGRMFDGAEIVVLAHDNGLVSLYAHLDAWASPPPVSAGDEVAAGQRIGTVGRTGIAYGMHLHWAVYRSGEPIDPLGLIGK
jgi:murein DD-endopeptidase MepM/ murein hydrolase activator NlpD